MRGVAGYLHGATLVPKKRMKEQYSWFAIRGYRHLRKCSFMPGVKWHKLWVVFERGESRVVPFFFRACGVDARRARALSHGRIMDLKGEKGAKTPRPEMRKPTHLASFTTCQHNSPPGGLFHLPVMVIFIIVLSGHTAEKQTGSVILSVRKLAINGFRTHDKISDLSVWVCRQNNETSTVFQLWDIVHQS
jgi:hypothetical protein